jgi:hypothetical protein
MKEEVYDSTAMSSMKSLVQGTGLSSRIYALVPKKDQPTASLSKQSRKNHLDFPLDLERPLRGSQKILLEDNTTHRRDIETEETQKTSCEQRVIYIK